MISKMVSRGKKREGVRRVEVVGRPVGWIVVVLVVVVIVIAMVVVRPVQVITRVRQGFS